MTDQAAADNVGAEQRLPSSMLSMMYWSSHSCRTVRLLLDMPLSAWCRMARICGSVNLLVFFKISSITKLKKILLLKPDKLRGDYPRLPARSPYRFTEGPIKETETSPKKPKEEI